MLHKGPRVGNFTPLLPGDLFPADLLPGGAPPGGMFPGGNSTPLGGGFPLDLNTLEDWYSFFPGGDGNTSLLGSLGNLTRPGGAGGVFQVTVEWLNLYLTPIIILIGIIGNTMSFFVFTFTHLQRLSSSLYLSSLALADVGFLLGLSIVWLQRVNVQLFTKPGWCQGITYVTHVCGFLAMWNVVSFTAERYVIVYHPLRKDTFCTKKKARIVELSLVVFALLFYSYIIWTFDSYQYLPRMPAACSPLHRYYDINTIMTSLDVFCACVVPSLLIVILNARIILKIHHYQTRRTEVNNALTLPGPGENMRRRSLIHTSVSTTGSMHIKFSSKQHERHTKFTLQELQELTNTPAHAHSTNQKVVRGQTQFRTARMLLILSSVFVCLTLPKHVFHVQGYIEQFNGGSGKIARARLTWGELFEFLYFLTFAINFFIYSACGRQFRVGLTRLCRRWRYKMQKCGKVLHIGRHIREHRRERLERLSIDGYNVKIRIPKPPGT